MGLLAMGYGRQAIHSLGVESGLQACVGLLFMWAMEERASEVCNGFLGRLSVKIDPHLYLYMIPNSNSTRPRADVSLDLMYAAISKSVFINPTACYAIQYASSL